MKVAVTGSSGFTGRNLIGRLLHLNHEVIKIDLEEGIDAADYSNLESIPKFDALFHLAAKSFVPDSYEKPHDFYRINFNSTLNTLELCRKYSAKYIYVSSYVYGTPQYLPIDENHPIATFNPYADSKILCENLCRGYNKYFNLNVFIVRPFNIYGPHQTNNFLIPSIFNQAIKGKIELNDPNPRRDLIYIDDLVDLYTRLLEYQDSKFEIFNAGYGKSHSVREIVEYIANLFPSKIEINFTNIIRPNEVADTVSNNNKAKSLLNWEPGIDLFEGLSRVYSAQES
jgi:UDP-glucose 4-epimerase